MLTQKVLSGSILDEQIRLEDEAVREGVARYRRLAAQAVLRGDGASLKPAERLMLHWFAPLVAEIKQEKKAIRRNLPDQGRQVYGRALLLIDAERCAVATMNQMLSLCMNTDEDEGVSVPRLAYAIGRAVCAEINRDRLARQRVTLEGADGKNRTTSEYGIMLRSEVQVTPVKVNSYARRHLEEAETERRLFIHLGARLIWATLSVASAAGYDSEFCLAFEHRTVTRRNRPIKVIRLSDAARTLIEKGHSYRSHLRPRYLPMIVPPYPWEIGSAGGYVSIRTPLITRPTAGQKEAVRQAEASEAIAPFYAALNAVSSTPWSINRRVLEVVNALWKQGGNAAHLPPAEEPPLPEHAERRAWNRQANNAWRQWCHQRSERRAFLEKLTVADLMKTRAALYFPHQVDFRGRCYPVPPSLNHQGDDLCRGLLQFAPAREADSPAAKRWLLIHAANCFGVDKLPYAQRIEWVKDHWKQISACAADPLGHDWWMQADKGDKPFQFLAACFALTDDESASHLPIQLDGTCNGLQHFSAMGRDPSGGKSVNLVPQDRPADIYAEVASRVARSVEDDARSGAPEAVLLSGMIDRDLVKQPVMTTVYGVTAVGARGQIALKLGKRVSDEESVYRASIYLARLTLAAMRDVCPGAVRIMDWLRGVARTVAIRHHDTVAWTTPLGFPVVQPYRNRRTARIQTVLQKITVAMDDERARPDIKKQIDGMAPNFVHSIDATHMLATAAACRDENIAFASVHDSYWSHAADTPLLEAILRRQFVNLHSRPLLIDLHAQLTDRYKGDFPPPPEMGCLDIKGVMDSPYFFC